MITGRVIGGLGNQLFQLFAILAYSIEKRVKAVFINETIVTGRPTYWDSFFKNMVIFTTKFAPNNITNQEIMSLPRYKEPGFEYSPMPVLPEGEDFFMEGYFQSYKYFEKVQDQLFSLLKLETLKESVLKEYSDYFMSDSVFISMHFRLGDYKQKRYYHPIIKYEYYRDALQYIVEHVSVKGSMRVLYFCEAEDNEFVLFNRIEPLKRVFPEIEFIKVDDRIDDWKQLLIMSQCHHFIIANSSFSWWGGYLCSFGLKIVCYPAKWFGEYYEHNYKCDDLMPESWIKIAADSTPWNQPLV